MPYKAADTEKDLIVEPARKGTKGGEGIKENAGKREEGQNFSGGNASTIVNIVRKGRMEKITKAYGRINLPKLGAQGTSYQKPSEMGKGGRT